MHLQNYNKQWQKHSNLPNFEKLYLEDSYVIEITNKKSEIIFLIDLVLNEQLSQYPCPLPNEQHCYKRGEIRFLNVSRIIEFTRTNIVFTDANHEADMGNIDSFLSNDRKH
jgi:hypothetical protein